MNGPAYSFFTLIPMLRHRSRGERKEASDYLGLTRNLHQPGQVGRPYGGGEERKERLHNISAFNIFFFLPLLLFCLRREKKSGRRRPTRLAATVLPQLPPDHEGEGVADNFADNITSPASHRKEE